MKVGIISFAHSHAYGYADAVKRIPGAELVGIADDNFERGKEAASRFDTKHYGSYEELLSQDIEAVIVTSENSMHHEHVVAAAKAKVHVLCEKPLATKAEDAEEMIKVCKENGVILQTAFPVRFNSSIIRAKHIVDQGDLGEILAIKGTNRGTNPGGWFVDPEKSGGGAVIDHTVHVVDVMRWFMGAEVKEVYAEIGNLISEHEIDDCGILTIEFDNNVFTTLDCSWSRNETYPTWGDVTLEIVGTQGTLSVDAFAQKLDVYDKEGVKWNYWGDDMDFGLVNDFLTSVSEGKEPSITGTDGLKALEVALAAYESSKKKQPVLV
ncbi:Gfo/Idh/MocA family protein [Fictibacillus phosphorivorans]|uniref:Gfo/Idh/MocA family protein n=1 Tax=Fictibacillus phosphorivorans TaxID=1221500 RepID=UPI00203B290D|nr:Gfo/Idh/MocA family oxidoreductase [Fictibacillus phosphorivorans]MCM3717722.1 Gfo/Idh/MocA family oxidoreductase [Fictibacillus phosphorivorans]MCM3775622.1 Gfo/Idh/MocA family oxidoreductase [Fictibacillus phosphorivorans]